MNKLIIHSTIGAITLIIMISHIYWYLYALCGDIKNPTCYGKADVMTLISKNISEPYCSKHNPDYCRLRDKWYYFKNEAKELNLSSDFFTPYSSHNIYDYDINIKNLQIGMNYTVFNIKQYHEFELFQEDYQILIPLREGGSDEYRSKKVPVVHDYRFCIAMFVICSVTMIIDTLIAIGNLIDFYKQRKLNNFIMSLIPGYAGHAI